MPYRLHRRRLPALALGVLTAAGTVLGTTAATSSAATPGAPRASVDPALASRHGTVDVVVTGRPGDGAGVATAVRAAGGTVTRTLTIVDGVAARVDASALSRLAADPAVRAVSLDGRMAVQADPPSPADVTDRPSVYRDVAGLGPLLGAGANGTGVTVALVDTGVSPVADLADRLVPVSGALGLSSSPCVNLSAESTCDDTYGHGTFVAGLIAGTGAASGGQYAGAAPGARILSVKIAGADGASDVSDVLAGIQWVVAHRAQYGIRVLNLSLGTDSTQSYRVDPLDYAVERAWRAGVVVVVAASNRGPGAGTISKPADDPFVLTVGAIDDAGTVSLADDAVPDFSSRGPTAADGLAKPDLVAPGAHLVSIAAPGSTITAQFPPAMAAPYRRGSGTSFAAGVVSGAVADVLSAAPSMTPDRVKYALTSTAVPDASPDPTAVGAGLVDAAAALNAPAGLANQGVAASTGAGSLEASRGTVHVVVSTLPGWPLLQGEVTDQLRAWDGLGYRLTGWDPTTWLLSQWLGNNWSGNNWSGNNWSGNNWSGNNWSGNNWSGAAWYGNNWSGSAWYGAWDG